MKSQDLELGGLQVNTTSASSLPFLAFSSQNHEEAAKPQGNRKKNWWNIHTRHLFSSTGLPVPSTKVNRAFSPLAFGPKCTSSYRSMTQQARKSASSPWPALTLLGGHSSLFFLSASKKKANGSQQARKLLFLCMDGCRYSLKKKRKSGTQKALIITPLPPHPQK